MTKVTQSPYPPQIAEIMQRIFRLKGRFKAGVPENIVILRKRMIESNLGGKASHPGDFDLFHKTTLIFQTFMIASSLHASKHLPHLLHKS